MCLCTENGIDTDLKPQNVVQVDRHLVADMSMMVGVKGRVIPEFNLRCLTNLALHGLQFQPTAQNNTALSPYLLPLVVLLKNAEQLRCLELSTYSNHRHLTRDRALAGGSSFHPAHGQMMRTLCLKHKQAGASPLQHLRYLRLGPGCELDFRRYNLPETYPHCFLPYLFTLSGLVELHLESSCLGQGTFSGYGTTPANAAKLLINPSCLPKLRKLSLPCNIWHSWGSNNTDRKLAYTVEQALTMRFVGYSPHRRFFRLFDMPPLSGLVLPTPYIDLQDIYRIEELQRIKDLKSVKTLLPSLCETADGKYTPHYGQPHQIKHP